MGEKKSKNLLARVKKLVEIKGTLYLCIPKIIAQECGAKAGDQVGLFAGKSGLAVVFPVEGKGVDTKLIRN
jgi:hypothetical protein